MAAEAKTCAISNSACKAYTAQVSCNSEIPGYSLEPHRIMGRVYVPYLDGAPGLDNTFEPDSGSKFRVGRVVNIILH